MFYSLLLPSLDPHLRLPLALLYSLALLALALTCLVTCLIDPADPVMVNYLEKGPSSVAPQLSVCLYCENCRSYVHNSARHCKMCGRCV